MNLADQSRRSFLAAARSAAERPNIVFPMPGRLRYHSAGCLKDKEIK